MKVTQSNSIVYFIFLFPSSQEKKKTETEKVDKQNEEKKSE